MDTGERALEKCENCVNDPEARLKKLRTLRECWVYKDRSDTA